MSYQEQSIKRGEKWARVTAKHNYESTLRDQDGKETKESIAAKDNVKWLNDNENIQADIKAYKVETERLRILKEKDAKSTKGKK